MLEVVTLTVVGLMTGNEFAIAAFVHPTLGRLPDEVHFPAAKAIARVLGRVMPFWYGLALVLMLGECLLLRHSLGHWSGPIAVAALLWVLTIVYTVAALVPINNRVASWTEAGRLEGWKNDRRRWDSLHRWRVLLLTVSFALLTTGLLAGA